MSDGPCPAVARGAASPRWFPSVRAGLSCLFPVRRAPKGGPFGLFRTLRGLTGRVPPRMGLFRHAGQDFRAGAGPTRTDGHGRTPDAHGRARTHGAAGRFGPCGSGIGRRGRCPHPSHSMFHVAGACPLQAVPANPACARSVPAPRQISARLATGSRLALCPIRARPGAGFLPARTPHVRQIFPSFLDARPVLWNMRRRTRLFFRKEHI